MSRFTGKVVIVTGSSGGIGAAAAQQFAKEGASVVIHGQNVDRLKACQAAIVSSGVPESRVFIISGPIEDEKTQDKLINETVAKFGRLDVLVNNAGLAMKSGSDPNGMESFDYVFNVNVRSMYRLIQLATPHLEKTKGNVVNISSVLSTKTYPGGMPYAITKAAVDHLTKNFANALAAKNIRVNSLNPGLVATAFLTRHGASQSQADDVYEKLAQTSVPQKRQGTPDEQADAILYLAAETSSYITGSILVNDGGLLVNN